MKRDLLTTFAGLVSIAAVVGLVETRAMAVQNPDSTAQFDSSRKLKLPTGYRRWIPVGSPLTPNGLNNGEASFPEFHEVYVEERNLDAYLKAKSFPEGTVIVNEMTRVLNPTFPDGSRREPSGRGFFNGEFNRIDVTVKNSKKFAKTNGGFFTFGHHPLPYADSAESLADVCAYCHRYIVAKPI